MNPDPALGVVTLLVGLFFFVLVMLVGREIVTWYWKVNEAVSKLEAIEAVLRNIDKNLITLADMAQESEAPRGNQGSVGS